VQPDITNAKTRSQLSLTPRFHFLLRGGDSTDVPRGFLDYLRRASGLRFPEVPASAPI
jgi:hypothetical protein